MVKLLFFFCAVLSATGLIAQNAFTIQDTLRGSITEERAWWDVLRYELAITPDITSKRLQGSNSISFRATGTPSKMQIDLQKPMELDSAAFLGTAVPFSRNGNVFYLELPIDLSVGDTGRVELFFSGTPREAVNPPWDGGWIWKRDKLGRSWVSAANQGLGASVWYPCKDHQSDEPDLGASISITVPKGLMAVANGKLAVVDSLREGISTFRWEIQNPINNYNIIPYIGHYVDWSETFPGEKGLLDIDYWVLDYNLERSKEQFSQVAPMLECFESWLGPYPFYQDGYKLIEAPHLGMEHQSAIAYGNGFQNGYKGRDLSGTGWGLKWDFIIVHESGHEWFGNSITAADIADMWIHESFTAYSETIFTQCLFGTVAGEDYVIGTRQNIQNDRPIIGAYGVNSEGSGDMYYKGANMIHTIRHIMANDSLFKAMLRGLSENFYHQTVSTAEIEGFMSEMAGRDLSRVFDQYLRTTDIPVLEFRKRWGAYQMRWAEAVPDFDMPVRTAEGEWLYPGPKWKHTGFRKTTPQIDRNFYIKTREVLRN